MNTTEFLIAWTDREQNLQPISKQTLNKFNLTEDATHFLSISGLPREVAPFLSFVGDDNSNDKYSTINLLTDWFDFLEPAYDEYVVIGSDCSGDIIAINTNNHCTVEWLDHEDYFSSRLMNISVELLANCMLCYRDFINVINDGKSTEECLDTEFTDEQFDTLYNTLKSIDQRVVKEGFWKEELELLLANREESRQGN